MPGMVLSRFGITNTWSTPYTYARSNIEQCLLWEKEEYKDFLEMKYIMKKADSSFPDVYRNIKYSEINKTLYDHSVNYGVEFTHHDVVSNKEHYESYKRKVNRMIELKKSKEEILFLYYHRYVDHDNLETILDLCRQFVDDFYGKDRKCNIAVIVQVVDNDRRVVYKNYGKVHLFHWLMLRSLHI